MRLSPEKRKLNILNVATELAKDSNYAVITRAEIAKKIGCAESLITHYYPKMCDLRNAVLKHGVENNISKIIAQGVVNSDKFINGVPKNILQNAMRSIEL